METFKEFTFEAAHETPPFSSLHGHSFRVSVAFQGVADPVYGWSHNLHDVESAISNVKEALDHRYLNDVEGLRVPSLENLARWIWSRLETQISGLTRIVVSRGPQGNSEGCCYTGGD